MKRVICGVVIAFALLGCDKDKGASGDSSAKAGAPAPAPASGGAVKFAGVYKSNWGETVFRQEGSTVTASYPSGSMSCSASGANLDCDWKEGGLAGKAKLAKKGDNIEGTWGKGSSATDGGQWRFEMSMSHGDTTGPAASFAGTYKSNWGDVAFTQTGSTVNATYANGSMSCTAAGQMLTCDWKEKGDSGKAKLYKQADGSIKGTWGSGASDASGGEWVFTRK